MDERELIRDAFEEFKKRRISSDLSQYVRTAFFAGWYAKAESAAPAPASPAALTDWKRISAAANAANQQYGQWMPERWLQMFVKSYNGAE